MSVNNTKVIRTRTFDPWWNLAVEEYLLNHVGEGQCILYLWQNQNTVVIGRNQNAWRECRTDLLESEGGKLARRLSGGGAVYHDDGNLNFTFLMNREDYDLERQLNVILSAVKSLGINAEKSGRNDLTANGRKFSGNAFYFTKTNAYHHGTILISSAFEKLSRYLQVSKEKIISKGIASVQSRVINLAKLNPSVTVDKAADAVIRAFACVYGYQPTISDGSEDIDNEEVQKLREKYASWEWRYGQTPKFDITMETRFPWGGIELGLNLENGRVVSSKVYSDAMDEAFISMLPAVLEGCPFGFQNLADRIRTGFARGNNRDFAEDIATWIEAKSGKDMD
ncbi:MAG: lipoate--protein ligase [Clostridiaceae bacterium]|nr:lipoate--protein ligase [Clostridiaceae bacterium]